MVNNFGAALDRFYFVSAPEVIARRSRSFRKYLINELILCRGQIASNAT